MAEKVTRADLARMAKKGTVQFDPVEQNIARFGELIDKMTELLTQKAADTQADLARSQVQLEVLATLQKNMSKRGQGVTQLQQIDLGPLQELLVQIQAANAERVAISYQFDIQRGEGGYMAGVTATPIAPTLN
jgi:hypothetical protein